MEQIKEVFKENWKHGLLMLTYLAIATIYQVLNRRVGKVYDLVTEFDRNTPFIKEFIIPYNIWYPFILFCMIYLLVKHRDNYYRTIIGLDIGIVICYIFYIFFQTTVPRPVLTDNDIFTKIVSITYKSDRPINCFPSIHVFTTFTMMVSVWTSDKISKGMKSCVSILGVLIILSTIFVKQHVILDVVGGMVLSITVHYMVRKIEEEKVVAWIKRLYSLWTMRKRLEI